MYPTTTIPNLHIEYRIWTNELLFYKEEIRKYERNLEKVIRKDGSEEVAKQVEHFQNNFIREKEVIDELKHKLHLSERQLVGFVKELNGLGLQSIKMDNHIKLRDDMRTFRKIYGELKTEFRKFECFCQQRLATVC